MSKASEFANQWAVAEHYQPKKFAIFDDGVKRFEASVTTTGTLSLTIGDHADCKVSYIDPIDALSLAKWLRETFGD